MRPAKVRSDCRYGADEIEIILPFKSDFITSSTPERMKILQKDILPNMFNYWQDNGKVYTSKESKALSKVWKRNSGMLKKTLIIFRNLLSGVQTIGGWFEDGKLKTYCR